MTDLTYDPEFPYVVVNSSSDVPVARFISDVLAADFALNNQYRTVIDTTPKPKIPEDAEYITWSDPYDNGEERIAMRYGHPANKVWRVGVDTLDELDLLNDWIGDAEVTVLVRKGES